MEYLEVYMWTPGAAFSQCLWIRNYESSSPTPPWPELGQTLRSSLYSRDLSRTGRD